MARKNRKRGSSWSPRSIIAAASTQAARAGRRVKTAVSNIDPREVGYVVGGALVVAGVGSYVAAYGGEKGRLAAHNVPLLEANVTSRTVDTGNGGTRARR
jgi:hypothetical protein